MNVEDRLRARVHEAVHLGWQSADHGDAQAVIVRAFVRYYAETLSVIPPSEGSAGYSAAIGKWMASSDGCVRKACQKAGEESIRLARKLPGLPQDIVHWTHTDDRGLCLRTEWNNEIPLWDVNAWWMIQQRDQRKRYPLAPVIEAWVKFATGGPPQEGWYCLTSRNTKRGGGAEKRVRDHSLLFSIAGILASVFG